MLRLSRSKVTGEIEYIIDRPVANLGPSRWEANGVECAKERHAYQGQFYGFDFDILRVASTGSARKHWELLVVTEYWRNAAGVDMHRSKWLKLVHGSAADVKKWISENRERGLNKTAPKAGAPARHIDD